MQNTIQTHEQEAQQRSDRGFVVPPANISATDEGYLVTLDMPGVDREGLQITVVGNELTITGKRKLQLPEEELCYCESSLCDFRRVFELGPDVNAGKITAEMQQGVVILRMPKSEKAKPRQIKVD